jgi:N-formylglutamate deformylase
MIQRTAQSIVWHIPHASTVVPDQERGHILLNDLELQDELGGVTDWYTDCLFGDPGLPGERVTAAVSRLVVDVERYVDDSQEPMAAKGLGAVYTHTWDGRPLRAELSLCERQRMIDTYYRPHHKRLEEACNRQLQRHNRCLIIDGHSFPAVGGYLDSDSVRSVPDVCIGTDAYHTPASLVETATRAFRAQGLSVAVDYPYAGTIVPQSFLRRDQRVQSIMVEINRQLMGQPFEDGHGVDNRVRLGLRCFVDYCRWT